MNVQCVFALSGEIDLITCEQVEIDLIRAADESPLRLVRVDCSAVDFIDSSGLQLLVRVDQRLRERGRQLSLARVPAQFRKVVEITQLEHLLEPAPALRARCNRRP